MKTRSSMLHNLLQMIAVFVFITSLSAVIYKYDALLLVTLAIAGVLAFLLIRQKILQNRELQAQEELRRVELSLKQSEHRFHQLVDLLPQTVFEMDSQGRLTFVNQYSYMAFGYSVEDYEKGLNIFQMIVSEDHETAIRNISNKINCLSTPLGTRYTAVRKDGSTFPIMIYSSLVLTDGKSSGLRGIIIDISEQERLKKEKEELKEQYSQSQKMEAIGLLAGGVAHDMNNLLSPIIGYGELLLSDKTLMESTREFVLPIHQAAIRARDLIRQLLAFSRKQTLEIKPLDLNQVIHNFQKLLIRTIRADIQIETKLAPSLPIVHADIGQIEQVVMNLAVNAQDSMPEGGRMSIETSEVFLDESYAGQHKGIQPGRYVMLAVSDSGCGMDAETRKRIFEPFFTTKAKGRGSGLGLSTVYGIIKQHGGSIWIYSEPGYGTTFKCYFPVADTDISHESFDIPSTQSNRGSETVVVAEDSEEVRMLSVKILEGQGYKVYAAPDGSECLRIVNELNESVDMLITDVIMPDMNGKSLYMRIAEKYPHTKVLYMSGYADSTFTQNGILEEGTAYIQKPFSVAGLAGKVREVLDSR